jgi:hypothetical protein
MLITAMAALLLLGACTNAITIRGRAPATGETFAGVLDTGGWGTGVGAVYGDEVRVASSNGPVCRGRTSGAADKAGGFTVAFTCEDGRTGTVKFEAPAPSSGSGTIGKDQVEMILGAWRG